jgi:hypothetical protein
MCKLMPYFTETFYFKTGDLSQVQISCLPAELVQWIGSTLKLEPSIQSVRDFNNKILKLHYCWV